MDTSEKNNNIPCLVAGRWQPVRTGDYTADCATGRAEARKMLDAIEATGNPALFGAVTRAICEAGEYGAVEAGFCSAIGIQLVGLVPA